jgi:selenocysteine lyase/cysteine desulfurase
LAHRHGARIVVDAAQLAARAPVSMSTWDVDYLVASGHKMYAPFGVGVLVGRSDWLDAAPPYLAGGGAVRSVGLHEVLWKRAPHRHEAGTPNLVGAVAMAAACDLLVRFGLDAIQRREHLLLARLEHGLADIPGLRLLRLWEPAARLGICSFVMEGHRPEAVADELGLHFGVGIRAGRFCAHRLVDHLVGKVGSAPHGGALRASVGLTTTADDVDRLLHSLSAISRSGVNRAARPTGAGAFPDAADIARSLVPESLG